VDVGSGAALTMSSPLAAPLSAWIYPEGWGGSNYGRIADKSSDTNNVNGWTFMVDSG